MENCVITNEWRNVCIVKWHENAAWCLINHSNVHQSMMIYAGNILNVSRRRGEPRMAKATYWPPNSTRLCPIGWAGEADRVLFENISNKAETISWNSQRAFDGVRHEISEEKTITSRHAYYRYGDWRRLRCRYHESYRYFIIIWAGGEGIIYAARKISWRVCASDTQLEKPKYMMLINETNW